MARWGDGRTPSGIGPFAGATGWSRVEGRGGGACRAYTAVVARPGGESLPFLSHDRHDGGCLFKLVLWLTGMVIALMTGNLSVYLLLTVFFLAPKALARVKQIRQGSRSKLDPGE